MKVSVIVLTYNHENFILPCLKAIAEQRFGDFEVVISDDCSTDKTPEIASKFAKENPKFRFIQTEKNLGPAGNFQFALKKCQGELLAICEGDDLWVSPDKLAHQTQAFEKSEVSLVYADYSKIDGKGEVIRESVLAKQSEQFRLKDLIDKHGPSTNSMMFRKSALPEKYPPVFFEVANPDVFLIGYALLQGDSAFIDHVLSAHREHEGGIWTSRGKIEQGLIRYATLVKFFHHVGKPDLKRIALEKLERQVILAREKAPEWFREFFGELPLSRRLILGFKWGYAFLRR